MHTKIDMVLVAALVEESGKSFQQILNQEKSYVKLIGISPSGCSMAMPICEALPFTDGAMLLVTS